MTDYMMSENALEEWAQKVLLEGADPRLKAMESRIDRIVQRMAEYAGAAAEMRLELRALKNRLDAMENNGLKAVHSVPADPAQAELFTDTNMGCWVGTCAVCDEQVELTPRHKARMGMVCEKCVKAKGES